MLLLSGCGESQSDGPSPAPETSEPVAESEIFEREHFPLELEARRLEDSFIAPFWDRMRSAEQPLKVLADLPVASITLGSMTRERKHPLGILRRQYTADGPQIPIAQWRKRLQVFEREGVILRHSDWHQESYQNPPTGNPQSTIRFNLHAYVPAKNLRVRVKGLLEVVWNETLKPRSIAVREATIEQRPGKTAFDLKLNIQGRPKAGPRGGTGPLLVRDLDDDGLPEILLGGGNRLLRNLGAWQFKPTPALERLPAGRAIDAGVFGDFSGDGLDDLLYISGKKMWLAKGAPGGTFPDEPTEIPLEVPIEFPTVLSAGDIEKDGDLDLFFGQWREISDKIPEPFWDAKDGYGNALLRNNGNGTFTDITEEAGLGPKRNRRTYSASLYDTEGDGDMDLIVVSDFYGVDLYRNNQGAFEDITEKVDSNRLFGMSHTFGDYDGNGVLDAYVLGMGSTTARRLDGMGAGPANRSAANTMRTELGYGNRMYLWTPLGYLAPPFQRDVARTGWTWGSTTFDFENDGDRDIYVANGHISGETTRDYCSHFWCKDLYLTDAAGKNRYTDKLFTARPELKDMSWDGFQANQLLVNSGGRSFSELGFLLDVGFTFDARKVVSADIDRDGRVDLLLTRIGGTNGLKHNPSVTAQPPALIGLRNVWPMKHPWIGFDLRKPGTLVQIRTSDGRKQIDQVVTGDSFYSQHPATLHFGLGSAELEEVVIQWPSGKSVLLDDLEPGKYHRFDVEIEN